MNNIYSQFRVQKDEFFEIDPNSPLTGEQKQSFGGLNYFPVNEGLRFEVPIEKFDQQEEVQIQTNTGEVRTFTRYGRVYFTVDGDEAALTVYANPHGFFIPFVDALAGKETYGAGRYLDPEITPEGKMELDFNLAYNPYCAYNDLYSCPLPPVENRLSVPIKAGEKNFKSDLSYNT
ncbi:MAG: DUF1684 domain-containing protein [Anaerolineales bacterium]|jgi:uncharacterized protein (DUF1684 family)